MDYVINVKNKHILISCKCGQNYLIKHQHKKNITVILI